MRVVRSVLLFATVLNFGGCIVVPYEASQGTVGTRTDVPATVPDSIVKGKTSRAEVLQQEGKPDGEGADWIVYSSTAKESGLGLFFCFASRTTVGCGDARRQVWDYHRLVVRFDALGVVSSAHVDSASCIHWTNDFKPPAPCLDLRGDDLQREDTLAAIQKGKQVLATFQDVRWPADEENDCVFYGQLIVTQDALNFVAELGSPYDRDHHPVDPAGCPEPDNTVAFEDTEIADIAVVDGFSGHQAVKLSRKDGSHFTYQFLTDEGGGFHFVTLVDPANKHDEAKVDDDTSAHATELAADIQKATGSAPVAFGGLNGTDDTVTTVPRTFDHVRWCSGWDPPTMALVQRQIPCSRPKDGYLVLTDSGFMFQLADAGDGVNGLVADPYTDIQSEELRDSGHWGSYSHWVVVTKKDGEIDAFDPDYRDAREEIDALMQAHLRGPSK